MHVFLCLAFLTGFVVAIRVETTDATAALQQNTLKLGEAQNVVLDPRNLINGLLMLADDYLDQPYCVVWNNASQHAWVCTITGNDKPEGSPGEHVMTLRSTDMGASWEAVQDLEPGNPLVNAYSTIVQTNFGRIYVLYNMNLDNVTVYPTGKPITRSDELGFFVFRYSDDGGITWSSDRGIVPIRFTSIDANNTWLGKVRIFWNVDQVKQDPSGTRVSFAFTKIGTYPQNAPEELWILSSPNLLTETNSSAVVWDTLPNGEVGILPPGGNPNIAEEGHLVHLYESPGSYLIFRTMQGYLGCSSTSDPTGATNWTTSRFAQHWNATPAAVGRGLKNPRGPITLKRFSNGKYLMLFYFNSVLNFDPRDPYWLLSGIEQDGEIRFSQPEIVLYDYINVKDMPGYPDFIEDNNTIYITETNKSVARVHPIDAQMLAFLFSQDTATQNASNPALSFAANSQGNSFTTPATLSFVPYTERVGVTVTAWITNHASSQVGDVVVSTQSKPSTGGFSISVATNRSFQISLRDASTGSTGNLTMDAYCTSLLLSPGAHMFAAVIDGGAHVLLFYVDGFVCDGDAAPTGWTFFSANVNDITGTATFDWGAAYHGKLLGGAWYARALYTSEVVSTYRAQLPSFA